MDPHGSLFVCAAKRQKEVTRLPLVDTDGFLLMLTPHINKMFTCGPPELTWAQTHLAPSRLPLSCGRSSPANYTTFDLGLFKEVYFWKVNSKATCWCEGGAGKVYSEVCGELNYPATCQLTRHDACSPSVFWLHVLQVAHKSQTTNGFIDCWLSPFITKGPTPHLCPMPLFKNKSLISEVACCWMPSQKTASL